MGNKKNLVCGLLQGKNSSSPQSSATAFAPSNIALVKYWGKRDEALNLPVTSSLSISLGNRGATTSISYNSSINDRDRIFLNQKEVFPDSLFATRVTAFLDLFRPAQGRFEVRTELNIPVSAGLASSACGYAALVMALDALFGWGLSKREQSILARLGSGSAARSLWPGFVEWQAGCDPSGRDSYGVPIEGCWSELCVGLLILDSSEKAIDSREAMRLTVKTCPLYASWPQKVEQDIHDIKEAIASKDFDALGSIAESNALTMHALMLSTKPSICYLQPKTLAVMQEIWAHRRAGLRLYFTEDAGPNLKFLFLKEDCAQIKALFPTLEIVIPFDQER